LEFECFLVARFREKCSLPLECDCVANSHCVVLVGCLEVRLLCHDRVRDIPPLFFALHCLEESRKTAVDVLAVCFVRYIAPPLAFLDFIPANQERINLVSYGIK
jgi:hypothetical protein